MATCDLRILTTLWCNGFSCRALQQHSSQDTHSVKAVRVGVGERTCSSTRVKFHLRRNGTISISSLLRTAQQCKHGP